MQETKPKKKKNHVWIFTSDEDNATVKQVHIRPWLLETVLILLFVIIGALIGYLIYEEKIWASAIKSKNEHIAALKALEDENQVLQQKLTAKEALLNAEIDSLNDKIVVLSNTLEQKVQSEKELLEQLNKQCQPTEFPLNGPANLEEDQQERVQPICIFTASDGIGVVATATGIVTDISEDYEFGYSVTIDHGNGYETIYKNQGKPNVKLDDNVVQGTIIFQITKRNKKVGYQMKFEGEFINPLEMISING